jgi:hypothetical protein
MRALLTGLLILIAASEAAAGAWPREVGTSFVSLSYTATTGARTLLLPQQDLRSFASVFAEHGLARDWTIGLDAGRGDSLSAALVFLRHPVWTGDTGHRIAAELGLGVQDDPENGLQVRVRPGLAWGRGFESRWGQGWAGLEASADLRLPTQEWGLKSDMTAGLKPTDRLMLIMQVQSGKYPGSEPIVRLAPSVVRRISESMHLQLGAIASIAGDDAVGLKLSAWFTF